MASPAYVRGIPIREPAAGSAPRHTAIVRATHWIAAFSILALLLSGIEIVISHPRFYWGETGNVLMQPLFTLPIPASRGSVPTGYGFVLPDQNSWSRSLHFQSAWLMVFAGVAYVVWGLIAGHFRSRSTAYNPLQRATYLAVVFFLTPLMIWTGLAMSPGFVAGFPLTATILGGQQSARTIHFVITLALIVFVIGHLVMVYRNGFISLTRAMITGRAPRKEPV